MAGSINQDSTIIRDVWNDNLENEIKLIRDIVDDFPYIGMDTEYPGTVSNPGDEKGKPLDFKSMIPDQAYAHMKANVDILKPIQLGLTFTDATGNLPTCGTDKYILWQFNFREFDPDVDPHNKASIELLKDSGIDFAKNKEMGVDCTKFAELLMSSAAVSNPHVQWVTFHGLFDIGFLVKMLTGTNLPGTKDEFLKLMEAYLPSVYDVKHLIRFCSGLHGGLSRVGELLGVKRIGRSHQAGSDSLLTCQVFKKLIDQHFSSGLPQEKSGHLHGLV